MFITILVLTLILKESYFTPKGFEFISKNIFFAMII